VRQEKVDGHAQRCFGEHNKRCRPWPCSGLYSTLAFRPKADGYLAFLGRIAPEKGPNRAIEIAARSGSSQ
jgi:glycosyltransferase involved in cell wall biosynthesis